MIHRDTTSVCAKWAFCMPVYPFVYSSLELFGSIRPDNLPSFLLYIYQPIILHHHHHLSPLVFNHPERDSPTLQQWAATRLNIPKSLQTSSRDMATEACPLLTLPRTQHCASWRQLLHIPKLTHRERLLRSGAYPHPRQRLSARPSLL